MPFSKLLSTLFASFAILLCRFSSRSSLGQCQGVGLRHAFASLLIQKGASRAYVRHQLSHSSIQVTVDVSGHLMPGENRHVIEALDAIIRNPRATSTSA